MRATAVLGVQLERARSPSRGHRGRHPRRLNSGFSAAARSGAPPLAILSVVPENVEPFLRLSDAFNRRDIKELSEFLDPDVEWIPIMAALEGRCTAVTRASGSGSRTSQPTRSTSSLIRSDSGSSAIVS